MSVQDGSDALDGRHASDSSEQRNAEVVVLAALSAQIGVRLTPTTLRLPGGSRVDVDGVADDRSVLVEVFAHQGRLKGGQVHKVARDALKLITVARDLPGPPARLIIAFADANAASMVSGKSWLAEALKTWGVEIFIAELPEELKASLTAAQLRQIMVNPPDNDPVG